MNIVISGYTAAGKTTHARLLAHALQFEFISAAEILLTAIGFNLSNISESEIWYRHNERIHQIRQSSKLDEELDEYLRDRARSGDRIVFDSRFLPWTDNENMVRIWLESDLLSRARKCCVSLNGNVPGITECARRIHSKDNLDVIRLAYSHEKVFSADTDLFDAVLDNSTFIADATNESAIAGIKNFHPYMLGAVRAISGQESELAEINSRGPESFRNVVRFIKATV